MEVVPPAHRTPRSTIHKQSYKTPAIRVSAEHLVQILASAFLAILFLQSGIDKIVDRRGNLDWLTGHFAKSPLAAMVPLMVTIITVFEVAAGVLSAIGCAVIIVASDPVLRRGLFRVIDHRAVFRTTNGKGLCRRGHSRSLFPAHSGHDLFAGSLKHERRLIWLVESLRLFTVSSVTLSFWSRSSTRSVLSETWLFRNRSIRERRGHLSKRSSSMRCC